MPTYFKKQEQAESFPAPTHDSARAIDLRWRHPSYSWCLRCGIPWYLVKHHSTWYTPGAACFPLCETCWQLLGCGEARIEYYKTLVDWWEKAAWVTDEEKFNIQRAVANGG